MEQMERVRRGRSQLVTDSPFFGVLGLHLELIEDRSIETMATDGKRLLVNPEFAATLSDPELRGVLAHEVYHCAMDHMGRLGSREMPIWNEAADYAINLDLFDSGFTLPQCALLDRKWQGMSAESIYAELYQAKQDKPKDGNNLQPGNGQPNQNKSQNGNGNDPGKCGGVIAPKASEAADLARDWKGRVISAAAVAAKAGSLPDGIARLIDHARKPRIDWRDMLRRFVSDSMNRDYSWTRPNRRHIGSGLYLPSMVSNGRSRVIVAIDTSGSIDSAALEAFKGELQALLDESATDALTVLYCDCELQGQAEFQSGDILKLEPKGFGGTSFEPVMTWAADNASNAACLIYFTDMLCGNAWGNDPGLPVLWANWARPKAAPFGEVIQIDGHN
jgi:predicted metal-dependent peptidase